MRNFGLLFASLGLFALGLFALPWGLEARDFKLDKDRLDLLRGSSGFDSIGDAFSKAIDRTLSKPIQRSKLPGSMRFHLETGISSYDIDDNQVSQLDDTGDGFSDAPDSFSSVYFKGGTGLPFGFDVETGFAYAFSDLEMSSLFANVGFQAFDFANVVYTDMVPAVSFSSGVNFVVSGPSAISMNLRSLIGAYHRFWLAQVTYVFEVSFISLNESNPAYSVWSFRHGLSSLWPLYEGVFISTSLMSEVAFGPLETNVSVGYQF